MEKIYIKMALLFISLLVIGLVFTNLSLARINPNSIVGIWLLDEGKGTEIKDMSSNKNNGKVLGAKWVDGKRGKALEFDGTSHAEIPASAGTDDYVNGFIFS